MAIKASLILKKRESKIEAEDNLIHSGARKHGPKSVQKKTFTIVNVIMERYSKCDLRRYRIVIWREIAALFE